MIIVRLQGGLGNQMFQYAFARKLSYIYGLDFKLDLTSYDQPKNKKSGGVFPRTYGLNKFRIIENIASLQEINRLKKFKKKSGKIWWLRNKFFSDATRYIDERSPHYYKGIIDQKILKSGKSIYLDGYWQSYLYFKEIESIIKNDFSFKFAANKETSTLIREINSVNSICLHIRRGDFLLPEVQKHHGLLPLEYYDLAIKEINKRTAKPVFFIFSDDINWAKKNLKINFAHYFVDKIKEDCEELRLMINCKNFINANSSFSWWAAWLSTNKNKVVILPDKLTKDGRNISNYAPKSWIKVETKLI